jgi:hypothetical protein
MSKTFPINLSISYKPGQRKLKDQNSARSSEIILNPIGAIYNIP